MPWDRVDSNEDEGKKMNKIKIYLGDTQSISEREFHPTLLQVSEWW